MNDLILNCKNINKYFGKKHIIKNVSLELYSGDILGFIGPNGSGKTTTIKLILGLQAMSSGKIVINGYDIQKDFKSAIAKVGAIIEEPDFYTYLSGYDNLKLITNLYKNIDKRQIHKVVKIVKLENRIHDKVSKYSLGMKQRLGIAKAILHTPNLLILDEPTNGLDPQGIKELRELLKKLSDEGISILLSSHNLFELETLCNKICIIQNGVVTQSLNIEELKKTLSKETYSIEIDNVNSISNIFSNAEIISNTVFKIEVRKSLLPTVIDTLREKNIPIYTIKENEFTLEDVFLKMTGGNSID